MLSVKQGGVKYHFWVFDMVRPGIEPRFSGPLANTLPTHFLKKTLKPHPDLGIYAHLSPLYEHQLQKFKQKSELVFLVL